MHDAAHARRIANRSANLEWGLGEFYAKILWPKIQQVATELRCGLEVVVTDVNILSLRTFLEGLGYETRVARGWLSENHGRVVALWIGW